MGVGVENCERLECCTNVRNPQDNDTDYNMGIIVSVPGDRGPAVPGKYP